MRLASYEDFQGAEAAFRRVFDRADDVAPFGDALPARMLLCPIRPLGLDRRQFEAVAEAAARLGVIRAYAAGWTAVDTGWAGTTGHRHVDLGSFESYAAGVSPATAATFLFAPHGEWGVMSSALDYAVVAGPDHFLDEVRRRLAYDEAAAVRRFMAVWLEMGEVGAAVEWVGRLLDHVGIGGAGASPAGGG